MILLADTDNGDVVVEYKLLANDHLWALDLEVVEVESTLLNGVDCGQWRVEAVGAQCQVNQANLTGHKLE